MDLNKFKKIVGGKFFEVEFEKKDGSIRKMNARIAVSKFVKGTGKPIADGRVGVWDIQKFHELRREGKSEEEAGRGAYRSLWPNTVIRLKVGKKTYDGEGNEIC